MTENSNKEPHPADIFAGEQLKERRDFMGLSQKTLGDIRNLSFQQIQKYERGKNRMAVSTIAEFSRVLEVPPQYFFEDNGFDLPDPPTRAHLKLMNAILRLDESKAKSFLKLVNEVIK